MTKLQEMFVQALRTKSGSGLGFIGKNKPPSKPRAAAVVVEFSSPDPALVEAAVKAGADGSLFSWNGKDAALSSIQKAIEAARSGEEKVLCGLNITGGWESLTRETFEHLKELEVGYVILPLNAPARLLALQVKDLELVVAVPMRTDDMYPIFIRNLTVFEGLAAVRLDFGLQHGISDLSIEDVLQYRAVREAVRFPSMLNIDSAISEADAYTLLTLGAQAVIIEAAKTGDTIKQNVQQLRELLEKVYHEEKDSKESFGLTPSHQ